MMEKIRTYINTYGMIEERDRVIAGISGGADSVCLLFVLLKLREERKIEIFAVHVNHGLRGEEAKRDEDFVRELCRKYAVPLTVCRKDVESIAKMRKQSMEEAGRDVRREALETAMRDNKGTKIALAHHKGDNAETVLLHLLRGSGLRGLGGIAPVNGVYVRPLLCLERKEIEAFLRARNISYCTDSTNGENAYTRNRIRNQILPKLEENVNAQAIRHINEAAEKIRAAESYLSAQAEEAFWNCAEERILPGSGRNILLKQAVLEELHPTLRPYVLKNALVRTAGQEKDLTAGHVRDTERLLEHQVGKVIDLPYEMQAVRCYEGIRIKKRTEDSEEKEKKEEPVVVNPVETKEILYKGRRFTFEILENFTQIPPVCEKTYTKSFDYDIIRDNVELRTRMPGDYIVIDKEGKRQKLKSYFINEKIPKEERDRIPLVTKGNQVLWIVGYRMSAGFYIGDKTKNILNISVDKGENKHGRAD